jgi:hypothetical protein
VQYTDSIDGNPFDGVGETAVSYTIDNAATPFYSITIGNGGLRNAVIGLQALGQSGEWQNLQVTGNVTVFANPWQLTGSGNWNETGSWTTGAIPSVAGDVAGFWNGTTGFAQVTVDTAPTVGTIVFGSLTGYQLIQDTNNYSITLDNTGVGNMATIDVQSGANTVSVPLIVNDDLNISIANSSGGLVLTKNVIANNHTVAVGSPYRGGVLTADAIEVSGVSTFTLDHTIVNLSNGTTLSADNVHFTPGSADATLNVSYSTLTTQSVDGGEGTLHIDGGNVYYPGGTSNSPVNVRQLTISSFSSFLCDADSPVTTTYLNSANGYGTFTLDGGTLTMIPIPTNPLAAGKIGGNAGGTALLSHFYLGANGGTIDTGEIWSALVQPIEDDPSVTAGALTITNVGALAVTVDSTYTGGTFIKGGSCVYSVVAQPLGTGNVDISEGGSWAIGAGANVVLTNSVSLNGPNAGVYTALWTDWDAVSAEFAGQITVNDVGTPGEIASLSTIANSRYGSVMVVSGKITGPGGVCYGNSQIYMYDAETSLLNISGTISNDYDGATAVVGQTVVLGKDNSGGTGTNTAVAVPHDLILDPTIQGYGSSAVVLAADNQTSVNTVVHFNSPSWPEAGQWADFALNGHATTVRGLVSAANGLNGIANLSIYHNLTLGPGNPAVDPVYAPTNAGTLTVTTQEGDDFTFIGYIKDKQHVWTDMPTVGALALVKDGPGIQRLVPSVSLNNPDIIVGYFPSFDFTGGTIVKGGTLDVSLVDSYTPNGTITVEGTGTMLAGDLNVPSISVLDSGTLYANSITTDTLTIGGVGIGGAAAAVPEPSTFVLLTLGGILMAFAIRKR